MQVDEFGREIPAGRGRRDRSSSSPPGSPYGNSGGGSGAGAGAGDVDSGAPSQLFEALPTGRYGREEQRPARKRKHRSDDSPPPPRGSSRKASKPHPSTVYADEPMLCKFLWKENHPDAGDGEGGMGNDNNDNKDMDDNNKDNEQNGDKETDENKVKTTDDSMNGNSNDLEGDKEKNSPQDKAYDEYRKSYCLNYVRTFFNEHMDDSWFRSRYSPLEKFRTIQQERERAAAEARQFASQLEASLNAKTYNSNDRCAFIQMARLGGGTKQKSDSTTNTSSSPSKSSYNRSNTSGYNQSASQSSNQIPSAHVLSIVDQVIPIQEIPPHVTDEQLTAALMSHCTIKEAASANVRLYTSTISSTDMLRSAYFMAPENVRKDIIAQLVSLDRGNANMTKDTSAGASHVPRKEDTYTPKLLELSVECSDAYGRVDIDADGKGGAPDEGGVPQRKETVLISTQPITTSIQVLSAALSSRQRISRDKEAATQLARAYDAQAHIPEEHQLDKILEMAFAKEGEGTLAKVPMEHDALDLSIAYLRRVHLLSYYTGCNKSPCVGDLLNGSHASSTIHLRLSQADDILQQAKDNEPAPAANAENEVEAPPAVDLLVKIIDDSIDKALEEVKKYENGDSPIVELEAQAKELEYQESQVEDVWIEDHALIDEDGRARCSFHFCRKLFKDSTFLKKHLLKKHSEYLRAERAKCHDSYMMEAWDAEEHRPVPPILVDCGRIFSLVPTPVVGSSNPTAEDPEPELWRRHEAMRKQQSESAARRERYHDQRNHYHNHRDHRRDHYNNNHGGSIEDRPLSTPRSGNTFVDVDDMKEEKVDMEFDNVEVPVAPPKKKKKKKKLL